MHPISRFEGGWPVSTKVTERYSQLAQIKASRGDTFCLGCTEREYQILNAIANLYPGGRILEIGPGDGCSSEMMLLSEIAEITQVNIDKRGVEAVSNRNKVNQWTGTSAEYWGAWSGERFDIVFVDGEHADPTMSLDIRQAVMACKPDGVVICHDTNQYDIATAVVREASAFGRLFSLIPTDGNGLGLIY